MLPTLKQPQTLRTTNNNLQNPCPVHTTNGMPRLFIFTRPRGLRQLPATSSTLARRSRSGLLPRMMVLLQMQKLGRPTPASRTFALPYVRAALPDKGGLTSGLLRRWFLPIRCSLLRMLPLPAPTEPSRAFLTRPLVAAAVHQRSLDTRVPFTPSLMHEVAASPGGVAAATENVIFFAANVAPELDEDTPSIFDSAFAADLPSTCLVHGLHTCAAPATIDPSGRSYPVSSASRARIDTMSLDDVLKDLRSMPMHHGKVVPAKQQQDAGAPDARTRNEVQYMRLRCAKLGCYTWSRPDDTLMKLHDKLGHRDWGVTAAFARRLGIDVGPVGKCFCTVCLRVKATMRHPKGSKPAADDTDLLTNWNVDVSSGHTPSRLGGNTNVTVFVARGGTALVYFSPNMRDYASIQRRFIADVRRLLRDVPGHPSIDLHFGSWKGDVHVLSDGAKYFTSIAARRVWDEHHVTPHLSPPYTPELNGAAERKIRTLNTSATCMRLFRDVKANMWDVAWGMARDIDDFMPTNADPDRLSAFEQRTNKLPNIDKLLPPFSTVYVWRPKNLRAHDEPPGRQGTYIGHDRASDSPRVMFEGAHRATVVNTRHFRVDDRLPPSITKASILTQYHPVDPADFPDADVLDMDAILHEQLHPAPGVINLDAYRQQIAATTSAHHARLNGVRMQPPSPRQAIPAVLYNALPAHQRAHYALMPSPASSATHAALSGVQARAIPFGVPHAAEPWTAPPPLLTEPRVNVQEACAAAAAVDAALPPVQGIDPKHCNFVGSGLTPEEVQFVKDFASPNRKADAHLHYNYSLAKKDPQYGHLVDAAAEKELTAMFKGKHCLEQVMLADVPADASIHRALPLLHPKFLNTSTAADDTVLQFEKYKCRLTFNGSTQKVGKDYIRSDTCQPRMETWRLHFSLVDGALPNGDGTYSMPPDPDESNFSLKGDVPNAYINADTKSPTGKPVYFELPRDLGRFALRIGLVRLDPSGRYITTVLKAQYGMCDAGRLWEDMYVAFMLSLDFQQSKYERCVFIRDRIRVLCHTDDFHVKGYRPQCIEFGQQMCARWGDCKIQHFPDQILSWNLHYGAGNSISISASGLITSMLRAIDMENTYPRYTPMPSTADPSKWRATEHVGITPIVQSMNGSINHIALTSRPDVSFASSSFGTSQYCPAAPVLQSLQHCYKYLRHSKFWSISYDGPHRKEPTPVNALKCYVDASDGDGPQCRSQTGVLIENNGGSIDWGSWRQPGTSLCTGESETRAAAKAGRSVKFLFAMAAEFGFPQAPIPIFEDNTTAICWNRADGPFLSDKNKHICRQYFFVSELQSGDRPVARMVHIPTHLQKADLLTKNLTRAIHQRLCDMIFVKNNVAPTCRHHAPHGDTAASTE